MITSSQARDDSSLIPTHLPRTPSGPLSRPVSHPFPPLFCKIARTSMRGSRHMPFIMRDKTSLNDSQTIRFDSDSMELSSEVNGSRQDRFPLRGKAMPSSPSCDIFWSKTIANTHHGNEEGASEGNPSIRVGLDRITASMKKPFSCWEVFTKWACAF